MKHNKSDLVHFITNLAVKSLVDEVELTPKPGLVDQLDSGAHNDLTLHMMRASAVSLKETFYNIADVSYNRTPSQQLREEIAAIGRSGERRMFEVTGGVNTHKGAIWALGLLVSAFSSGLGKFTIEETLNTAGEIASYSDRFNDVTTLTNGNRVKRKFGVHGAKEQAEQGFPHIANYSMPALNYARKMKMTEDDARKYSLLSLIAHLDDTCILHRGGMEGLEFAKTEAMLLLKSKKIKQISTLNEAFVERNISPGGSADLLAATLFLDESQSVKNKLQEQEVSETIY